MKYEEAKKILDENPKATFVEAKEAGITKKQFDKWSNKEYVEGVGIVEKKKPEALEELENQIGFVWDERELVRKKNFMQDVLNDDVFFFGQLMPENVKKTYGKGKKEYTVVEQVQTPILITSTKKLIRYDNSLAKKYKIKFGDLPASTRNKWGLEYIRKWLDGTTEKVKGKELLKLQMGQYEKYIYSINKTTPLVHVCWDGATYFYELCEAFAGLDNQGMSGSGKTKKMTISSFMAFNGGDILTNDTEATAFREKNINRGSSYVDEAEKLFQYNVKTNSYDTNPKVEIYNASYSRVGKVYRNEKVGSNYKLNEYNLFSPTQYASIAGLRDPLKTRVITIISTKSPNDDGRGELDPLEDSKDPIWAKIRDMNYRFALENWQRFKEIYLNFPKDTGLKRRDFQIWKPLLTYAKLIGDEYYDQLLDYAQQTSKRKEIDYLPETSFDYKILFTLKNLLEIEEGKIPVQKMAAKYLQLYPDFNMDDKKKSYLGRNISNHLDKLGFKDLRERDKNGSFFNILSEVFNQIVNPICPELQILRVKVTIDVDNDDNVDGNRPEVKKPFLESNDNINKNKELSTSSTSIYTNNVKEPNSDDDRVTINEDSKKIEIDGEVFTEC